MSASGAIEAAALAMPAQERSVGRKSSEHVRVFVGEDAREPETYNVCVSSLRRHASVPVEIRALNQPQLRQIGLYWRQARQAKTSGHMIDVISNAQMSTEFAFTRFLVPALCQWQGWALFCDADFVWADDVAKLWAERDDSYAVQVVQHDHRPREVLKMDGCVQTSYPRKNWSSLILWNCGHPANKHLTPTEVNTRLGSELHRFHWLLSDDLIGALDEEWNWLAGISPTTERARRLLADNKEIKPRAWHLTLGTPELPHMKDAPGAEVWLAEREHMLNQRLAS